MTISGQDFSESTIGSSSWLRRTQTGWSASFIEEAWGKRILAEWVGQAQQRRPVSAPARRPEDLAGDRRARLGQDAARRRMGERAGARAGAVSAAAIRPHRAGRRDARRCARGDDRGRFGHNDDRRAASGRASRSRGGGWCGRTARWRRCSSSEDPESLRGPQFDAAWCDELAKWKNARGVLRHAAVRACGWASGRAS